jgi:putative nucleotidyltransferase with HDIG domain
VAEHLAALGVAPAALEAAPLHLAGDEEDAARLVRLHFRSHRPWPQAFPRVALRLLELAADPEPRLEPLCAAVEEDPLVVAGVLACAASATARGLDPIDSIRHAVTRLGLAEVARLAAAVSIRALYDGPLLAGSSARSPLRPQVFLHALTTARLAAELARGRQDVGPELAFMAGLLHDVGLAAALRSLSALTLDGTLPPRQTASTLRILQQAHLELGADLHRSWGLPPPMREAAARHHEPGLPAEPGLAPAQLVKLASALDLMSTWPRVHPRAAAEAIEAAQALGVSPAALAAAVVRHEDAAGWARRRFAQA